MGASIPLDPWLTWVACVGQLALVALAVSRAGTSPLALPLAWLSAGLFSWNFAAGAYAVSQAPEWRYFDVAVSPLTLPLALAFVAAFVGRRRELGPVVVLTFVIFGIMGCVCLSAAAWPAARPFAGSPGWAATCLVGVVVVIGYAAILLFRHLRNAASEEERIRTRLVAAALMLGAVLGATEFLADLGFRVPRGGSLGTLAAACVLAVVALRFRLLEEALPLRALAYSFALGVLAIVAYLGVFFYLRAYVAMVVVGTVTVTVALLASLRHVVHAHALQRERLERMALLGRFSAQMAHDLKNPIAALKGAVQLLQADLEHEEDLRSRREFLDLLEDQVDRVAHVVNRYHRLGRLEAERELVSVNELVHGIIESQSLARGDGVRILGALAEELPACAVDPELLGRAIDNLVRNAREASAAGAEVVVRTESRAKPDGRAEVFVLVQDRGAGMDPRVAERAFDDFFTTKAGGSGFGLFFVKRVAEAHGGDASLTTRLGRGTEARIWIPAA